MIDLSDEDERAVERLSFYMLKEAYGAVASVVEKLDPAVGRALFDRIETQIEAALHRIHSQKSEGPASTAVAMAIAETLVPIMDAYHGRVPAPDRHQSTAQAATAPAPRDPARRPSVTAAA